MFRLLIFLIWLIDILNIDFIISGTHVKEFLDVTVPINTLFWLLFWLLAPVPNYYHYYKEK